MLSKHKLKLIGKLSLKVQTCPQLSSEGISLSLSLSRKTYMCVLKDNTSLFTFTFVDVLPLAFDLELQADFPTECDMNIFVYIWSG
jgi:hypothetical protein